MKVFGSGQTSQRPSFWGCPEWACPGAARSDAPNRVTTSPEGQVGCVDHEGADLYLEPPPPHPLSPKGTCPLDSLEEGRVGH